MNAIVNVNPHWGIGKEGKRLVQIPADEQRFMELTLGKTVVYGRKTLASMPGGKPLQGRENIILTKRKDYTVEGAVVCHSMEELRALLQERYSENVFVCGGEYVYKQLVPFCDKAYVTFSYTETKADKVFPNLNTNENWKVTSIEPTQIEGRTPFRFVIYENDRPKQF